MFASEGRGGVTVVEVSVAVVVLAVGAFCVVMFRCAHSSSIRSRVMKLRVAESTR